MTSPRIFAIFAALMVFAGIACAAQPEGMHSFADLYRLTVGAEYGAGHGAAATSSEAPQRASRLPVSFALQDAQASESERDAGASESASAGASSPPPAAAPARAAAASREGPYVFSTGALPRPGPWLLLLSGLALAAWVARRRLGYSL